MSEHAVDVVGDLSASTACLTSCADTLDTDGYTCIAATDCDTATDGTSTEYILNSVCYFCNNYPNIDTEYPYMRNCKLCTDKKTCTECQTGYYLRNDLTGCVRDCS